MFKIGYLGLFAASFLAATIIPFSSEAILSGTIYASYNLHLCIAVATLGNWLGGVTSYYLGYLGKQSWIERYLRIPQEKTINFKKRLAGKEHWVSFFCWLPLIGDVIAVTLGLLKANQLRAILGMFIGKLVRYIVWGYFTLSIIS